MGEERLTALIQESLSVATRTGAAKPADFSKVIVDTTVQPKAGAFPTDAKLMPSGARAAGQAGQKNGRRTAPILSARRQTCADRPSALRPRQAVNRVNRALKTIRTYLGRVIRDVVRKIRGEAELGSAFAHPLMLARRVREQLQHQHGKKVYSLHAPEVECIGKSVPSGLTRGARRIVLTNSA